jgi:hypothetical protein
MRAHLSAFIFSVAIIIAGIIIGSSYKYKFKTDETVSVIGSAEYDFSADLIVWSANFDRTATDLTAAYASLKKDAQQIQTYLTQQGIEAKEIIFSSISISKQYDETYNSEGRRTGSVFKGYKLHQNVKIESKKIDNVEKISRDITQLIQSGIELNSGEPLYYYTKLSDLKVSLLAKASTNAYSRASTIAENSHTKLGKLKKASMGIFQITGQYSNEDFTYMGAFNTSSRNKTANVTVRADFELK